MTLELVDKSYKTAIARTHTSRPVSWMEARQRALANDWDWTIKKASRDLGIRVLDYGCGRGFDADYMGADKYDPYWFPVEPTGEYDVIFCTYVLNVVDREEQKRILKRLDDLGAEGCVRYVTVRRDLDILKCPIQHDGYAQYYVFDGDMKKAGYMSASLNANDFEIYVKSDYGDY